MKAISNALIELRDFAVFSAAVIFDNVLVPFIRAFSYVSGGILAAIVIKILRG